MAQYSVWDTTSVTSTIQEKLVREDVSDLLSNLFPTDAPAQQALGRVPMSSTFTERPIDFHTNIDRDSTVFGTGGSQVHAREEGFDYSTTRTPSYPERLISVAQIVGERFEVSRTDRAVSHYAISDRFAYEALKVTEQVVNDFELDFWWSPGSAREGVSIDGNVVRQTQGICHWVCKTGLERTKIGTGVAASFPDGHGNEFGTDGGVLNDSMSYAFDAGGVGLDSGMFKEKLMAAWWQLTGRTGGATGFCGSRLKALFSKFALSAGLGSVNERTISAESAKVVDRVDLYDTDHGIISMNLCRYLDIPDQTTVFTQSTGSTTVAWDEVLILMQPRYFNIGVLRGTGYSPLAQNGDFDQGLIVGEQSMVCTNPLGAAALVNCGGVS